MRGLRRLAWSAAIALAAASPALAQTTGGNIGSPATQSAAIGPTMAGNTSGNTTTGNASGTQGSSTPTGTTANAVSTYKAAPLFSAPSASTNNTNGAISASNFLGNTFSNVYYQGSTPSYVPNTNPGGFGRATYNTATAGRTGAAAGGRVAGGRGSGTLAAGSDSPGVVAILPRQIAYRATVQFKVPGGGMIPQLQSDLRSAIASIPTDLVANPAGVQVMVDGRTVTLRGSVQDEEEAHTIVGMVRLTPGVGAIKNELAFPR